MEIDRVKTADVTARKIDGFDDALVDGNRAKRGIDYLFFQSSGRVGQEQAQSLARIIITILLTLIFLPRAILYHENIEYPIIGAAFLAISSAYHWLINRYPDRFPWKYYLTIFVDLGMAGYIVYRFGISGLAFYPLFLWIVIGNGLRFGEHRLRVATLTGLLSFFIATLVSGLASGYPFVVGGMMLGLAMMPHFFLIILGRLSNTNSALLAQRNQVAHLATHDELTDLPNRRHLEEHLIQAIARAKRSGKMVGVVFFDLDNFKSVNDSFGHDHGDILLKAVANTLRGTVRASDSVIRFGGDEFIILLEDIARQYDVVQIVELIITSLRRSFQIGQYQTYVTCSCGVAMFPQDGEDFSSLIKNADIAMFRAKEAGRDHFCFYDKLMSIDVDNLVNTRAELRQAIDNSQLCIYLQPQVEMPSRRIIGAEALARWIHPKRGMLMPVEFIPLAENTGLIQPLGMRVLELACKQLALWAEKPDMSRITVAVNISPLQFRQDSFIEQVESVINDTGANPKRLKLELTESLLVSDIEGVINKMVRLKEIGVTFSLDDFGTGYSSLSYLIRLPLDQLKIDRSFVMNLESNDNAVVLCAATISLAHSLKFDVVAEGVETEAQCYILSGVHRCDFIQGYLFGRPLPVQEFEAMVSENSTRKKYY